MKLCSDGFTLSELLVALAVLAIISTFSISKILVAQQNIRRNTVFKETLGAMNTIFTAGCQQGLISETNFGTYMINNLNAVKICATNAKTEGCWHPSAVDPSGGQASLPGVVLANGAFIAGLDDASGGTGADTVLIDWNGMDGPNTEGNDQMIVRAFIDNTSTTSRVMTMRDNASYPLSQALFFQIFQ